MADITLYGVPVSAFVAKVRIVLDMKGMTYTETAPPGGYGSPAYRARVPAGSVPGIVIDGEPLHDSNAIIELLEEITPNPALMPTEPFARARVRAFLGFHDTRLEAAARTLFPLIKTDWRAAPDAVDAGIAGIDAALERLSHLITPGPFAMGKAATLADIAYPVTLQMAEMLACEMERGLTLPPALDAWRQETAALPAVARSLSIAGQAMEGWLAGFRAPKA